MTKQCQTSERKSLCWCLRLLRITEFYTNFYSLPRIKKWIKTSTLTVSQTTFPSMFLEGITVLNYLMHGHFKYLLWRDFSPDLQFLCFFTSLNNQERLFPETWHFIWFRSFTSPTPGFNISRITKLSLTVRLGHFPQDWECIDLILGTTTFQKALTPPRHWYLWYSSEKEFTRPTYPKLFGLFIWKVKICLVW